MFVHVLLKLFEIIRGTHGYTKKNLPGYAPAIAILETIAEVYPRLYHRSQPLDTCVLKC